MGCLIGLFKLPYGFLKWCFTNGGKGYIVLGITMVVVLILLLVVRSNFTGHSAPAAKVEFNLPTLAEAPLQVTTPTRKYYALKAVKEKDGTVTMTTYWELLSGNKWTRNPGSLNLDKSFGNATIGKRTSP